MVHVADTDVLVEVLRLIESTLKVPADQVDIDASLESFGVNSLIVMELMENIEKTFDITLTPAQFSNIDTVRGLAGLVESLVATPAAAAAAAAPVVAPSVGNAAASTPESETAALLDYVRRKYAVDLSGRAFASVDDVADTLLSDHTAELMRHYGLSGEPGAAYPGGAVAQPTPLIAIVGLSCRLPDAPNPHAFWDNLVAHRNSVREIPSTRWNVEAHYADQPAQGKTISKWGALIDDVDCFDAAFFGIPASEAATIDPQLRLLFQETYRAVEDAGVDMKSLAGSRTGVFVGYEYSEYEQYLRRLGNQDIRNGPVFSSSSPTYYLSNRISHTFDLKGPSESFNVNCASGAVAINRAVYSLRNGESDLAIVAAASLNLFADDYIAASQYGVLSPDGTSGVFDDAANGFTRGEGVAAVVLKRLDAAERDNDRIYGLIRASHQNYRGAARNVSEVKHEAISDVLAGCYEKASVDLESISYVEVDGYASKWADSFEYEGVKGVFGKSKAGAKHVALGSVKGNIGNVESVTGVANLIKLALSLHHKVFPATISKKKINGFIDIDNAAHPLYIADRDIPFGEIRKDDATPIRAGINSFADSGTNVHLLLEEYLGGKPAEEGAPAKLLFVLSAKTTARLAQYVDDYIAFLSRDDAAMPSFAGLVYTAQTGREALNERLAIVASSRQELRDKLALVAKNGIKERLGLDAKEIWYGRSDPADKNAVGNLVTPDMAQMQLGQSARAAQWKQVALLWVNGVAMPWASLWPSRSARRASLPTYPFARERHWVDIAVSDAAPAVVVATPAAIARVAEDAAPGTLYFYLPRDVSAPVDDGGMNRIEKIERFLKQEIAAQLGCTVDDVSPDKDFLELGMNSIGVAELIIRTDRLLGVNLSPSVLFKHPHVGTLAEYLADTCGDTIDALTVSSTQPDAADVREAVVSDVAAAPATPQDIVVPLQTKGERPAIFAVPGAGGSALSLQQLSRALGDAQPFWCLEPVGLDGREPPVESVDTVADFNIAALRTVQSQGPYRLLGYSNGGIVAYAMAAKLVAQGETVASLILLDSLTPAQLAREPADVMTVAVFNRFVGTLGGASDLDVERLRAVPEAERRDWLYAQAAALGVDLPQAQFAAIFDAATTSERGCRAYAPPTLATDVDVVLLRATDGFRDVPDDYGWGEFLAAAPRTHAIAADHFTLLEQGPVTQVAERINPAAAEPAKKASRSRGRANA